MKLNSTISGIATALSVVLASTAFAADEYNVNNGFTLTGNPLGMHGVDPVSMFQDMKPAQGNATFTSEHDGVDYYFASADAQAKFDAGPSDHLPQFGGFCAFGVFVGKKLDGDVRYADIVDGKLYLFVNSAIFDKYLEDKEAVLTGAKDKWSDIVNTPVGEL
ncbi:YHS domain-containing (seleno)protein [Litoreibacter albidus]|uniref:YHS domain-containing protein n=1 Tax=Litoreibacter albidus TaxID=670155 RepID=A0A1H3ASB9_9RHOB|nr:YHS domain-containing (seleno)protein [Litoreibacter albidus]SDX32602.1 YHS domain-containing protein [Litoreibacter albidus]